MTELNIGSTLEEAQNLLILWHKKWAEQKKLSDCLLEHADALASAFNSPEEVQDEELEAYEIFKKERGIK